jgi:hypothetical protein
VRTARNAYLDDAGRASLDGLLRDYTFVRVGDLASLAFCNNWTEVDPDGCGYAIRVQGASAMDLRQQYWRRHAFRAELARACESLGVLVPS